MSSNKQTKFNKEWIKDPAFSSWVGVDPYSDTKARCMLCGYSFELGNMGKQSLVSHANGKKHKVKAQLSIKVKQEIKPIDLHFDKVVPSTSVENNDTSSNSVVKNDTSSTNVDKPIDTAKLVVPPPPPLPPAKKGLNLWYAGKVCYTG